MYEDLAARTAAKPTITPIASNVLQRQCACGQHTLAGGECEECKQKREGMLQRAAINPSPVHDVPPIVHEVLRSPGQPLDAQTRAYMESRFGHDFSGVRVYTDAKAAESARSVNALAYTVGSHIAFDADWHQPYSTEGRQLIAHELAHVVQQSHSVDGNRPAVESHLEAEADRAASAVVREGAPLTVANTAAPMVQRQQRGGSRTPPQPTPPTTQQQRLITAARQAAAIRCQVAMFRVGGIVPPGPTGRIDPSVEWRMRARSLAQVMFEWENPNMEQISEVLSSMVTFLTANTQVMIAPANDPECGTRAAYVRGLRPPIVLCSTFINDTPEQQIRTMIHEAAHLARIGSAGLGESYCVDFDCTTSCGGFDSADSWAHFVHCLSGQKPDQPTIIQGRAPRGGQGQTPRRGSGGQR